MARRAGEVAKRLAAFGEVRPRGAHGRMPRSQTPETTAQCREDVPMAVPPQPKNRVLDRHDHL